jgi:uncharacterized protein
MDRPEPASVATALPETAGPVPQRERIASLDALRGFALLGILLMNIVAMAMHGAAYDDPTVAGGATGANLGVWAILHVLAEGKMRCLFSIIFGASLILLTTRLESRGDSADIFYRRALWLMLFGVAHAYLLWLGDILYLYALCALALYPFRNVGARKLLITGAALAVLGAGGYVGLGFKIRQTIREGLAAEEAAAKGSKLSLEQEDARQSYQQWRKRNRPTAEELRRDAEAWRGSFVKVVGARAEAVGGFHNQPYYSPFHWDAWSMMLIGMGLMKLGVLTGERSTKFYALLALAGYGIGVPVNGYSAWRIIATNFDPVTHTFLNSTYDLGRFSVALGHAGVLLLVIRAGGLKWLTGSLRAVGQMAFSNYILHSLITAFLFTGYGFKLYGTLERHQIYYVVAAIWVFQMIASPLWLRAFRFGPLEWGWRSLTYWQRQPMRRAAGVARAAVTG